MTPAIERSTVAWINTDQMREIDRVMVDELGIALIQMIENAGRHLARVVLNERPQARTAVVFAGPGGNGGGGLVAARHLANAGVGVTVVLSSEPERMSPAAALQLEIVRRLGLDVRADPTPADVAIDALVGYGLRGDLDRRAADLVSRFDDDDLIVSLDVPSGLDATTGRSGDAVVRADATVTLCLPKTGLADSDTVGRLYLADISVPPELAERVGGHTAPPFRLGSVLRLNT